MPMPIQCESIEDFDPVFLDDGIGQHFMSYGLDVFAHLLLGNSVSNGNVKKLALTDIGDGRIPQAMQGRADSLPLRVEYCRFERDKHTRFHQISIAEPPEARASLPGQPLRGYESELSHSRARTWS